MHNREIAVFNLASTATDAGQIRKWLDFLGTDYDGFKEANEAEAIIGVAGKRCYMAFEPGMNPNVKKVRNNWVKYFENILSSGHGSILEHVTYNYAIENVSRVFTGEMNRHRAGVAISEGSMRFIRFDDIPFWMPTSIRGEETQHGSHIGREIIHQYLIQSTERVCDNLPDDLSLEDKKNVTRLLFKEAFERIEQIYTILWKVWDMDGESFAEKKKITSCLRRIIPMGVCTGGVWTFNLRALRHIIALRSTEHAEEEIALVVGLIMKDLAEKEPNLFGDFELVNGFWVPKYQKV